MACVMGEPADQARPSLHADHKCPTTQSSFVGRQRLRECRFADLNGCRWYLGFPLTRAFRVGA